MISLHKNFKVDDKQYLLTTDKNNINFDAVYAMLSSSYWAGNRSKEVIVKSAENSITFSLFYEKEQIGFARILTDYATMFYLFDFIIKKEYRHKGIGKKMLMIILSLEPFVHLKGMLNTKDAQSLYMKFGFTTLDSPDNFMWKLV